MWFFLLPLLFLGGEAERLISEADALVEKGDAEHAARVIRSWLEGPGAKEARDGRLWAALGRAARAARDFETAAPAFARAFAENGDLGAAFSSSECYLEMKDAERAESVLARCGDPSDPAARAITDELKGMALFLKAKEAEARPFLERARGAGRKAPAHFLGLVHFHRGEYEEALSCLEEAVRAQPDDYYSLLYRAWTLLELKRTDGARRALEETRSVAATPEIEDMLGRVELRAERFEAALSHFRAALASNPGYAEAQSGVATSLRRLGRNQEAKAAAAAFRKLFQAQQEDLRIAYELNQRHLADPRDAGVAEDLCRHYLQTADLQEAERFAWKALAIDPDRQTCRLYLARALTGAGRYQEAAFHYRKILRAKTDHAEARSELEDLIRRHARKRSRPDG